MAVYRMYSGGAAANENVVELIRKSLEEAGEKRKSLSLDWVGFEAPAGTEMFLNNHQEPIRVPTCGKFITPYNGTNYMTITSLIFTSDFTGDIYYIY